MPKQFTRLNASAAPPLSKPRLEDRLADEARFIRQWLDKPGLTGAVSPSGRFLARMMAQAVDPDGHAPIIELGPGTGPITQALLTRGIDPRRLVLVEFDPAFCGLLRERFPKAQVVQGDAYALRDTLQDVLLEPAAAVVSSLPLLNKPDAQRLALLDDAFSLMGSTGSFVQFTYGVNSPVPRSESALYHAEVSPPVWFNLPPARVWIYRQKNAARTAHPLDVAVRGSKRFGLRMAEPALFKPARPEGLFKRKRTTIVFRD